MVRDAWLPAGHPLPDGARTKRVLAEGQGWQVLETQGGGRALLASSDLVERWVFSGLLTRDTFRAFDFRDRRVHSVSCGPSQCIQPLSDGTAPGTKSEALAFALAMRATREIDPDSPLQDALYLEHLSRLLPTFSISSRTDDDIVLGYWLTGGAPISAKSFRRLSQTLTWLAPSHLKEVVEAAGFEVAGIIPGSDRTITSPKHEELAETRTEEGAEKGVPAAGPFELPGRPELEAFFNEHIIDVVQHRDRYRALGIGSPAAVLLHGPPGCGKTFAVSRLIDYLGWPSFEIEASTVASPYIHETSRKVAEMFDKAIDSAPSVLVIDEMESFLAERGSEGGHHRVEEVGEFLRRIPEAAQHDVLIIAMTNRLDMIDPAILRRGRFDHVVKIDTATETEVLALLKKLLSELPVADDVDAEPLAASLTGRPLSDVAYVIREGARLAARAGKARLEQACLLMALESTPARTGDDGARRRIGFV